VDVKNITLSVDEDVLAVVRRYAVDKNSSVNALVRDYLTGIAEHEDRATKPRRRIRQLSKRSAARMGQKAWSRQELHER
jgi:uncharacterized protein DUF6364